MDDTFNLYVGAETGLFKAVNLRKNTWCNINKPGGEDRTTVLQERQIECLCWNSSQEKQICLGLANQTVCIYDVASKDFVKTFHFPSGIEKDILVGLCRHEDNFIIATKSGSVKLWTCEDEPECKLEISVGNDLERLRQNATQPTLIATGGRQNDLKIWDLANPKEPVFRAKNVKNDFLNLEVPIWVTDMAFLPDSRRVVTCTGHHQIRVYDPAKQRRPVADIEWDEYPIKALGLHSNGYHVIVGNVRGEMALVDLRGKAYVVQKYKGGAGSLRAIQCHATQDVVASCGLDRHVRIHEISSRKLLQKFYMKSKLNCLLFSSQCYSEAPAAEPSPGQEKKTVTPQNDISDSVWDEIETIKPKKIKRKSKDIGDVVPKAGNKVLKKDSGKKSEEETEADSSGGSCSQSG